MRSDIRQFRGAGNVIACAEPGTNAASALPPLATRVSRISKTTNASPGDVADKGMRDVANQEPIETRGDGGTDALTTTSTAKAKARTRHLKGPFRVGRSRTGLGLFATEPIRKGKFIIEYWGKLVRWNDTDNLQSRYLFDLNKRWAIDGADRRNTARYINHACKPNAVPYEVRGKIKIYAKRKILPGEEITYDYGKEYFEEFLAAPGCKCAECLAGGGRMKKHRKH
jgi:uncharacterized protein